MGQPKERQRRARVAAWVGPWLRSIRLSHKVRRDGELRTEEIADVAERLDILITSLSRIERGETFFPSDELPKFLAAYRTTVDDFAAQAREVARAAAKRKAA